MNFGEVIKKEIVSKKIKDWHCKKAFLAGIIRGTGTLYEKEGELCLSFKCYDEDTSFMVAEYLDSLYNYQVKEITVFEDRLNKKDKYELVISGEKGMDLLCDLDIFKEYEGDLTVNFNFYGKITEKECCFKAFLRGLFLSSGVCLVPDDKGAKNTKYHLELVFSHPEPAAQTNGILLKMGIKSRVLNRKGYYVLYVKSVESIMDFLAFIGTPVSVLRLTDLTISKEAKNEAVRRMNCDISNLNKQLNASEKQISAIEKIEKTIGLDSLKKGLKEIAIARKDYPEDTLQDLAERLNLSKSCLNHRLRKIVEIANEIKGN